MAEPDAAGPPPRPAAESPRKVSRPLSVAAAIRQMQRQTAPLVAEIERAAKLGRQLEAAAAPARRIAAALGLEEDDPAPPPPEISRPPNPPAVPAQSLPPQSAGRPAFESDPPQDLLAALRHAYPGFEPVDGWWIHVEGDLKDRHHRSNPSGHGAFCVAFWGWTAADLLAHLEDVGLVPKPRKPRGPTVCERLRDLHAEDPEFAETASVRKLAKRIGKATGTLDGSHYYQTKLKPRRAEVAAQKKAVKRAQRWGDFDSVGCRDTAHPSDSGPEDH